MQTAQSKYWDCLDKVGDGRWEGQMESAWRKRLGQNASLCLLLGLQPCQAVSTLP